MKKNTLFTLIAWILAGGTIFFMLGAVAIDAYNTTYRNKIYPGVTVGDTAFGGTTENDVKTYLLKKNKQFLKTSFTISFEDNIATVSGSDLNIGYDATLSATQALLIGRSGHGISDLLSKFGFSKIPIEPLIRYDEQSFDEVLDNISERIDIPAEDALFSFINGKVTAFRPSHEGRHVNKPEFKAEFEKILHSVPISGHLVYRLSLPVIRDTPMFTTDSVNSFGIKELVGRGYSEFEGSIPGRIHNVNLAAARLNGVLIKPDETFSFNQAVGDISALTGYQPAYIIKDGRTVLGDGGGVCQVSTTLFRAAMDAGLPIEERHAHAYRVHYYEEGGFKPGMDATVFAPTVDLKIKNDTPAYLLIQTKTDINKLTLTFELYGTRDGRHAEIINHQVWGEAPPPPDLYQDDPTLPSGVIRQVDFAAWGSKASFQYRVTKNGVLLDDQTFTSNFRPWQAVFLKGTQQ